MEGGLAVITSADRSQPNRYEFYVDDTEHKDFVFLTGIYDAQPPGHVLVLNPGGDTYREVLYTDMDPAEVSRLSGIVHVFPRGRFLEHMSSALNDYSCVSAGPIPGAYEQRPQRLSQPAHHSAPFQGGRVRLRPWLGQRQ
jgi:hypothetical protein